MSDGGAFLLIAGTIAFLFVGMHRQKQTRDRRAAYNRQIGQPDLAAPLPSEQFALQKRRGGCLIALLLIVVLFIVAVPMLWTMLAFVFAR